MNRVLPAIDRKDTEFYSNLTDEERKAFKPFVLIRFASSVENRILQEWCLCATNERVNKHYFDVASKYPDLVWALLTSTSAGMGTQRHNYIKTKPRHTVNSKLLDEFYPHLNEQELQILNSKYTKAELKQLARDHGWDEKDVKKI